MSCEMAAVRWGKHAVPHLPSELKPVKGRPKAKRVPTTTALLGDVKRFMPRLPAPGRSQSALAGGSQSARGPSRAEDWLRGASEDIVTARIALDMISPSPALKKVRDALFEYQNDKNTGGSLREGYTPPVLSARSQHYYVFTPAGKQRSQSVPPPEALGPPEPGEFSWPQNSQRPGTTPSALPTASAPKATLSWEGAPAFASRGCHSSLFGWQAEQLASVDSRDRPNTCPQVSRRTGKPLPLETGQSMSFLSLSSGVSLSREFGTRPPRPPNLHAVSTRLAKKASTLKTLQKQSCDLA
ncbi:unnamed protein product, partial [Polarella glacialis]